MISTLLPDIWADYELIDSGSQEKLERFGKWKVRRPEPQAIWSPSLSEPEWGQLTDARFVRSKNNPESGAWQTKGSMQEKWYCSYLRPDRSLQIKYKLSLSSFKHVGIFPEQAANWDYAFDQLQYLKRKTGIAPKVLNLFGYTGIASVISKAAGADVTHLDSVKQVVTWARENMEASGLDGIRWMVDDALKFVQREERRGNLYQCLILDPPAYGRGPNGEKWILEEKLPDLLLYCSRLLDPVNHCFILNLYSLGMSSLIALNLMNQYFPNSHPETGEIYLEDRFAKKLPLGIYARFISD
jgi:23S rRNA (cytosine1962-C5)-methyltransferase